MNAGAQESREVPVDILPPLPKDAAYPVQPSPGTEPQSFAGIPNFYRSGSWYHPASGVVILAIDWLVFGTDLVTGFLALPVMCVLSFLISFVMIYAIQLKVSKDKEMSALGKAFLGAFLVGLPFPITGTLLGAAVLALSGLPHHPVEIVKKLVSRSGPAK